MPAGRAEPENVWILARHGADAALVTPWSYNFGAAESARGASVYLHRPARLPAGAHRAHQGEWCACKKDDTLQLPQGWTPTLEVTDSDGKKVFHEGHCRCPRTERWRRTWTWQAMLRWATTTSASGTGVEGGGSFYVEEYKKPEYQVTVKVPVTASAAGQFDSGEY